MKRSYKFFFLEKYVNRNLKVPVFSFVAREEQIKRETQENFFLLQI